MWKLYQGQRGEILYSNRIELLYPHDNENVIYTVSEVVQEAGFSNTETAMIATAASELSTNILRFARKGTLYITIVKRISSRKEQIGIELLAEDYGPGIHDINLALKENYSTITASLGLGLPSVKRIMDEFYIESYPGEGTRVLVYKWRDT